MSAAKEYEAFDAERAELRKALQLCRESANRNLEAKREAEAEVARLRGALELIGGGSYSADGCAAVATSALEAK